MKFKSHFFIVFPFLLTACGTVEKKQQQQAVGEKKETIYNPSDYPFKTVSFRGKIWMAENLNTDRFKNGEIIREAKTVEEWDSCYNNQLPCWCYYNNDTALGCVYGKIYNCFAVSIDLGPEGWHIATDDEWDELVNALGGKKRAGNALKSRGNTNDKSGLWIGENVSTDSLGFTMLPGGMRSVDGAFDGINYYAYFWTLIGNCCQLFFKYGDVDKWPMSYNYGFYVRCVKDKD